MNQERLNLLFTKYKLKSLTIEEVAEWQAFVADNEFDSDLIELVDQEWYDYPVQELIIMDTAKSEQIFKNIISEKRDTAKTFKLWPRFAIAASIMLAIITGGYFYYNSEKQTTETIAYQNDIAPGKNGATLTLADGKKIRLTNALNGKLAEEAGVIISKTEDGQLIYEIKENQSSTIKINTLSTSNGETYQVRLPDGTAVWLNAASSISYPASFASLKERRVQLVGEAYFEVAKDKLHPFIVKTDKEEVEVLGTHFNINSYANEPIIRTTLLEGSVIVRHDATSETQILKPNQQAIFFNNALKVKTVIGEDAIAWKNGLFVFEDETLESIMKRVSRWYNIPISYEQDIDKNVLYGGSVSRSEKVSKVLAHLEATGGIHFKIEERRIVVTK